jgi:transcriptional regulator NrdR family protein
MTCPCCGALTRVIRTIQLSGKIVRIRKCLHCKHEFTTTEKAS